MLKRTITGALITAAVYICGTLVLVIVALCMDATDHLVFDYTRLCIYGILASVVGEFGDLAMSSIKRVCKVKDFGNLLPGHGGILDRFDSHIFAAAFTLVFCNITGGFIL